jgi:hypothetical protein
VPAAPLKPRCNPSPFPQVLLTFYPDGCAWPAGQPPVVVSEGFLGDSAGLSAGGGPGGAVGGFLVEYGNSAATMRLRVNMTREIDLELVDSQRMRALAASRSTGGGKEGRDSGPGGGGGDGLRLGAGAALAQGRPLTLHLWVPMWVVNGTQLPIGAGVIPVSAEAAAAVAGGGAGGAGGAGGDGDLGGADGGSAPLRVVDTDVSGLRAQPPGRLTVMPNSIELLSFPEGVALGSGKDGADLALAAVISIMGSRWSAPLQLLQAGAGPGGSTGGALDAAAAASAAVDAAARLPRLEPVLVRARSQPDGVQHEVTARIEGAGSGLQRSVVLRLEPHLVISNRTGHTLHLIQPEPIWRALGGAGAPPALTAAMQGGAAGAAWFGEGGAAASRRPPSLASATPVRDATLVLHPGSVGVPVSWPPGCVQRLLSLALPQRGGGGAAAPVADGADTRAPSPAARLGVEDTDPQLWSESFRVDYPASGAVQIVLPVLPLGEPGAPAAADGGALREASLAFRRVAAPPRTAGGAPPGGQQAGPVVEGEVVGGPPAEGGAAADGEAAAASGAVMHMLEAVSEPLEPVFVHVAKYAEGGVQEYLAVAVQVGPWGGAGRPRAAGRRVQPRCRCCGPSAAAPRHAMSLTPRFVPFPFGAGVRGDARSRLPPHRAAVAGRRGAVPGAGERMRVQRHAAPCSAMQSHAEPCRAMQSHAEPCRAMQSHAEPCMGHTAPCDAMLA